MNLTFLFTPFIILGLFSFVPFVSAQAPAQGVTATTTQTFDTSKFSKEQLAAFNKLTPEQKNKIFNPSKPAYPEGTTDCQDYFGFGKISVDVSPTQNNVTSGTSVSFSGNVINPFNYPVVEGQVFAKIFYINKKSSTDEHLNGYRLVDQFVAVDGITLKANEKKPVTFTWQTPLYAQQGDYQIAFYYSSAHHYSLTGLTFTNDITGNKATFDITNATSTEPAVYFNEDEVTLNDKNFYFAQPIPTFGKDEKVVSHLSIVNPKNTPASVEVSYKLYSWDSLFADNFKTEKTETVVLQPKETRILSYEIPTIDAAVSYLVAEVRDHDAKSVLDIRFGRNGVLEGKNNKLGVVTYPLKANATSTLFACVHSAGPSFIKDGVITITLKDASQKVLHTYTYTKGIMGNVLGLKDDFILSKDLYDFTLTSTITQGGKPTEEIVIHYNCKDIDASLCPVTASTSLSQSLGGYRWLYLVLFAVIVIGGLIFIRKRKSKNNAVVV